MRKLLILLALCALPAIARADIVIDNFSSAQFLVTDTTTSSQSGPDVGVFGSYREMILTVIPSGGPNNTAQVVASQGRMVLNTSNDTRSILETRYDGITSGGAYVGTSLAPTDVTEGGVNKGVAFLAKNDIGEVAGLGGATVALTVTSTTGHSTASITLVESAGFLWYFVPFSSFVGTADLTAIRGVRVIVSNNDDAEDVDMAALSFAVPAPSGVVLSGLGLAIGLAYAYRRRRLATL
jgi:hypothetical protein